MTPALRGLVPSPPLLRVARPSRRPGALLRRALGGARGHGRGVRARCASHCGQHRTAARPGSARARSVAAGGRADSVCAVVHLGHHPCGRRSHGPCHTDLLRGSVTAWSSGTCGLAARKPMPSPRTGPRCFPPSTGVVGRGSGRWALRWHPDCCRVDRGRRARWEDLGAGIVLHRGGDGRPGAVRRGLYVLSEDLSLGVDEQGPARLVWGTLDGRPLDLSTVEITLTRGGRARPAPSRRSGPCIRAHHSGWRDGPNGRMVAAGEVGDGDGGGPGTTARAGRAGDRCGRCSVAPVSTRARGVDRRSSPGSPGPSPGGAQAVGATSPTGVILPTLGALSGNGRLAWRDLQGHGSTV